MTGERRARRLEKEINGDCRREMLLSRMMMSSEEGTKDGRERERETVDCVEWTARRNERPAGRPAGRQAEGQ